MKKNKDTLDVLQVLLDEAYIDQAAYKEAKSFSKLNGIPPEQYLLTRDLLNYRLLGQAIAEFYKVKFYDLKTHFPDKVLVKKISESIAKKYRAVAVEEKGDTLLVVTDQPDNLKMIVPAFKKAYKKKKIEVYYSHPSYIDHVLLMFNKPLVIRIDKIRQKGEGMAHDIIQEIIDEALISDVSDIHFEPRVNGVVVRFRRDGLVHNIVQLSEGEYKNVLNLFKIWAHLRIDEHALPQDGSIRYALENGEFVDTRLSIVSTINGEKVALRILSKYVQRYSLSDVGLSNYDRDILDIHIKAPFGMILVTGPTGSGKTTTLYSVLKKFDNSKINITTIEDPVEYRMDSINQIQVNNQTGLGFARGLRTIVRQDPDVILVGEIRDIETAEISVNAALTGHLLLSTFHSNDSATAVPRLLDMGIEPFLMASTLECIISQRLIRKICISCRHSRPSTKKEIEKLFGKKNKKTSIIKRLYEGKGCPVCAGTGYSGRTALFEIISMTPAMRDLILKSPSSREIWAVAKKDGAKTMFEDGVDKIINGITSIEEVLRVASRND